MTMRRLNDLNTFYPPEPPGYISGALPTPQLGVAPVCGAQLESWCTSWSVLEVISVWEQDECKYCTPTGVEIKERHRTTRCSHQVSSCNVVNTSIFKYKSKTSLIKIKIHLNSQKENKYLGFCFFASPENSVHEPRVLPCTGPNSSGDFVPALGGHGMVVRLDIFHWIHRFHAAIRTDSHSKYVRSSLR